MPVKRVLADCVVLSLQDSSVFYPSCRGCFSRIDVEQDGTRCGYSCKCGYSCLRELVDYRYRLSVWATRDGCIFGITVFGTCLNPYFGINARGLQRLLEISDGPIGMSTRSTFLLKAVEDCFIGRHFLFGLKLPDTERLPWVKIPETNASGSTDKIQVIASQMIPPKASVLGGCTVVSYYQTLLEKAAESELHTAAPLLRRHHAENCGFEHDASGFGPLSLPRTTMHQDSTLSPTPPFQQSLGLVTSSAEQECRSNQDSVVQNNSETGEFHTPRPSRRRSPDSAGDTGSNLTPLSFSSPLAPNRAHMTSRRESGNSSIISCLKFSPAGHISKPTGFSTSELNEPSLADSVVWEELPFSESLSKFLLEENMVDNVENQVEMPKNSSKLMSMQRNLTSKSTFLPCMQTQMADRRSQTLRNITNTGHIASDYHELPDQGRPGTRRLSKNVITEEQDLEDAKTVSPDREETFGRDSYNFSADLFNGSLVNNVTTNAHTEIVSVLELAAEFPKSPESERMRKSFITADIQDLDFVPPSQSTPIVRGAQHCSYRPNRFGHSFNPKWSFGKGGEAGNQLRGQQHVGIRTDSPSVGSTESLRHRHDSGCSDLTVCNCEDSREAIFPPTPVAKTKHIRKDQIRTHIEDNGISPGLNWGEEKAPYKRVRLNQAPSASHTQTGSCATIAEGGLEGRHDDSYACNYSRDLFSDSL